MSKIESARYSRELLVAELIVSGSQSFLYLNAISQKQRQEARVFGNV